MKTYTGWDGASDAMFIVFLLSLFMPLEYAFGAIFFSVVCMTWRGVWMHRKAIKGQAKV